MENVATMWWLIVSQIVVMALAAFALCKSTKVRYRKGQLEVKYPDGEWNCYDIHIDNSLNTLRSNCNRRIEQEHKKGDLTYNELIAKIHANHRPDWEYLAIRTYEIPIHSTASRTEQEITLRCKKCGYDKKFLEKDLPITMKNALIKAGILKAPE